MHRLRPLAALWIVWIVWIVWITIPLGCVDGAQLARGPADHAARPDDPAAPEAPFAPPPALGASVSASVSADPAAASAADPAAGDVVYTCPMHPEIRSDAPGKCPKCGMTLVPRPRAEGAPGHQHHEHQHGGAP